MANENTLLRVENLCQYFGSVKAVDDVSFEIKKGEVFGLVGESGCGKTTTGRSIIKIYDITSGSIYFKDQRICAGTKGYKDQIKALRKQIKQAVKDGFTVFITGMARGVDLWAAEIVLDLRKRNNSVKLICAIPHEDFEAQWSADWQQRYHYVQNNADLVRVIGQSYHPGVYRLRNEWMVNHSSRVIAVFNGQPSGTKNTIDYAYQQGVPVIRIEG